MRSTTKDLRRDLGLCTECGGPLDRDGVQCSACRAADNRFRRGRKAALARAGRCITCGETNPDPEHKNCPACRAKNLIAQRKSREQAVLRRWDSENPTASNLVRARKALTVARNLCDWITDNVPEAEYVLRACGVTQEINALLGRDVT